MKNPLLSLLGALCLSLPVAAQSAPLISTFAGTGNFGIGGDGGPAALADLGDIWSVVVDGADNVYLGVSDGIDRRIRRIDADTGVITTVVGGGALGYPNDGQLATDISIGQPGAVAIDAAGNIYFGDDSMPSGPLIRRVDAVTHIVTTIAGGGTPTDFTVYRVVPWVPAWVNYANAYAYAVAAGLGDGGPATSASIGVLEWQSEPGGSFNPGGGLSGVDALAVDPAGNVYVAAGFRVRRIDANTGIITTVAGNGAFQFAHSFTSNSINPDFLPSGVYSGDGGPATDAGLSYMFGMALDPAGNIYVSDLGFASEPATSSFDLANPPPPGFACEMIGYHRIRRIDANTGVITTVVGTGEDGFSGDGGAATSATLGYADGLAVDPAGALYIADHANAVIRKLEPSTGIITSVVGTPLTYGFAGDGGPADQALLSDYVGDVAFDSAGDLYLSDWSNARIRKVTGLSPNAPPTANAGPDQSIHASDVVQLDGTNSFDDNTPAAGLSYSWSFSARPLASTAILSDANASNPTFVADQPGNYTVELVVTDAEGVASVSDQTLVSSNNLAPTADAGSPASAYVGGAVTLDGSASSDPDFDALDFAWFFTAQPVGSTALLVDDDTATPQFTPSLQGTYVVGLFVFDGFDVSALVEVTVTVVTGDVFAEMVAAETITTINQLPIVDVTSAGNQKSLTTTLSKAVQSLQDGDLADARRRLQAALERTDGCRLRGSPDTNGKGRDWVTDCAAQEELYLELSLALDAIAP